MSLLFCVWADQEEEGEKENSSEKDNDISDDKDVKDKEEEKKDIAEDAENKEDVNTSEFKDCSQESTLLPNKIKPLIGPKSAIKRLLEQVAEKDPEPKPVKEPGSIIFNTLTNSQSSPGHEEDMGTDDAECPKYFYCPGDQEISDDDDEPTGNSLGESEAEKEPESTLSDIFKPKPLRRKPSERTIKVPARLLSVDSSVEENAGMLLDKEQEDGENTQDNSTSTDAIQDLASILPALGLRPKKQTGLPKGLKKPPKSKRFTKQKRKRKIVEKAKKCELEKQDHVQTSGSSRRNSYDADHSPLDSGPITITETGPPQRRVTLNRRAKPHTFSQIYDMDPESPFLYTSERRKGPQVSMEMDEDEDYSPGEETTENDENDDDILPVKIKIEPKEESYCDAMSSRKRKSTTETETFGFGISLGSVFSLAENTVRTRNMSATEPVIIKTEAEENWVEPQFSNYSHIYEMDPLGDPLDLKTSPKKIRKPFLWPKLDPLFRTTIEYRLPKEFDIYIKALAKPTAEISPIPKTLSQSMNYDFSKFPLRFSNSSISISRTSDPPRRPISSSSSAEVKPPAETESNSGLRRSGRKRKGKFELRKLLGDSPTPLDSGYLEEGRTKDSQGKGSAQKISPVLDALSETISRITGSSSVTITPIRDRSSNKLFKSPSKRTDQEKVLYHILIGFTTCAK